MMDALQNTLVRCARIASFGVPLLLGIFCASPEPYWLDSPEFTAAAQTLGIPHPPGHPLWVMLVKPFTLLPLGSVALRVSVASALFGAVASLLVFELLVKLVERGAVELPSGHRAVLSLAGALLVAVAPGWWFQSVRAEVYSLQILLILAAVYPLVLFTLAPPKERAIQHLYVAAFFFGLSLCNHHFMALAALPAAIPALVSLASDRGGKGAALASVKLGAVSFLGLLPYLFIPLRSAAGSPISLGGVHSARDFWWVVSAKVYQKSMAKEHASDLEERSLDAVFTMMSELGPLLVVASLAGFYFLLRRKETRLVAVTLFLVAGIAILLRSIMGFDPFNPDYYGYMLPAVAVIGVLAAYFAAVIVGAIRERIPMGGGVSAVLCAALMVLPVSRAKSAYREVDLSEFKATRLFYDLSVQDAQTGSLILASYYKLFFVLWSAPHIDGSRPDLTVINPQLFGYPGYLASTVDESPRLRSLAWSMIVNGKITESAVSELSLQGPLKVEPSPWVEENALGHLLPSGAAYNAVPEPLGRADVVAAAPAHMKKWKRLLHLLGPHWEEHETWRMLSWCHYQDALFFARRGAREEAREAVKLSRSLGAATPQLMGLEKALATEEKGPLDVTPFLPSGSGEAGFGGSEEGK